MCCKVRKKERKRRWEKRGLSIQGLKNQAMLCLTLSESESAGKPVLSRNDHVEERESASKSMLSVDLSDTA